MSRVIIVQQAQDELESITDYIAAQNSSAAERFVNRLFDLLGLLAERPLTGEQRSDLSEGLRSFSFSNYVIFFRPLPDGIRVVHLIHSARDIGTFAFDD
jgi:toxin ParE1/3/4